MSTVSVVVITLNEERNLSECLGGVAWADELIVVDSGSSDGTVAMAQKAGARVITRPFTDYGDQKNFALAQATCDWVLSLDADERVSPELAADIRQAIADPGEAVGFAMLRHERMLGRWIHHGSWGPQYRLRLIRRGCGQWQGSVHEVLVASGPVRRLRAPLLHWAENSVADIVRKANWYTTLEAHALHAAGIRPSLWRLLFYPLGYFLHSYIWRRGFLDGRAGLILAILTATSAFLRWAKVWEMAT